MKVAERQARVDEGPAPAEDLAPFAGSRSPTSASPVEPVDRFSGRDEYVAAVRTPGASLYDTAAMPPSWKTPSPGRTCRQTHGD